MNFNKENLTFKNELVWSMDLFQNLDSKTNFFLVELHLLLWGNDIRMEQRWCTFFIKKSSIKLNKKKLRKSCHKSIEFSKVSTKLLRPCKWIPKLNQTFLGNHSMTHSLHSIHKQNIVILWNSIWFQKFKKNYQKPCQQIPKNVN